MDVLQDARRRHRRGSVVPLERRHKREFLMSLEASKGILYALGGSVSLSSLGVEEGARSLEGALPSRGVHVPP